MGIAIRRRHSRVFFARDKKHHAGRGAGGKTAVVGIKQRNRKKSSLSTWQTFWPWHPFRLEFSFGLQVKSFAHEQLD